MTTCASISIRMNSPPLKRDDPSGQTASVRQREAAMLLRGPTEATSAVLSLVRLSALRSVKFRRSRIRPSAVTAVASGGVTAAPSTTRTSGVATRNCGVMPEQSRSELPLRATS